MTQLNRKTPAASVVTNGRFRSDLWESDGPICVRLWKQGYNTLEIASIMGAKEHEIYNSLPRWKAA